MANKNVGGIEWLVDADTTGAVTSMGAVNSTIDKTETKFKKLDTQTTKTAKGVKTGMAGMSRGAGQAGIQLQQFIGQVQGGQAVMLAFSQQAADVGIVLGAPMVGAILGITASLVGMLLPSLMNSKKGMELLEKATENVKASLTLGVDGVISYTSEMKKLKLVSENLAKISVARLIAEQNMAMAESGKMFKAALSDARSWQGEVKSILNIFGKDAGLGALDALQRMQKAADNFDVSKPAESVALMEKALTNASKSGLNNTKVGIELSKQMTGLIAGYKVGERTVADLDERLKDLNFDQGEGIKTTNKLKNEIKAMVSALQEQATQLNETDRQTAVRIATENKATAAQVASINASYDKIEANAQLIASQKEIDAAMDKSLSDEITREQKRALEKAKNERDKEAEKKAAVTITETIISRGDSPQDKIEKEKEQLKAFRDDGLITAKQYQDALTQIEAEGINARKQAQIMAMSSFSNSFGQIADVLKSSEGEQSNAYKAMFAISKGFAVAQAGLHLSSAIMSAYDDPLAITTAAKMANVALVAGAGAGFLSAVAGATYSGRENGGSVLSGQTYEVGEKNKPELLMIPGNNGKVLSNAEMKGMAGGGGATINQTINNTAAAEGWQVQSRGDGITTPQVIDIIRGEMGNPNSYSRRAQSATSDVTNKPRSRR